MNDIVLPDSLRDLMAEIYQTTGIEEFILYGGTPMDLLLDKNNRIHDLDIGVRGIDEYKISDFRERIRNKGFRIVEPHRDYFIYINKRVVLVYAENDKWFLDVGFLEEPELVGQFDAESLYCRYPELDCVDSFNAIEAIRRKTLKPIRGLESENPYLLVSRFTYLCAKYDMSVMQNPNHKSIAIELKSRMENWVPFNEFHGPVSYTSCVSSILKSILKSKNKLTFITELSESGILEMTLPELHKPSKTLESLDEKYRKKLYEAKSKQELITFFEQLLEDNDKELFKSRIRMLQTRRWDAQDVGIQVVAEN